MISYFITTNRDKTSEFYDAMRSSFETLLSCMKIFIINCTYCVLYLFPFIEILSFNIFLLTEMTKGVVFACEIIEDSEGAGTGALGPDFIRIRIRGQSFMLQ